MNQITRQTLPVATATDEQVTPVGHVQKIAVGRRGFLTTGTAAGGGLLLGLSLIRSADAKSRTSSRTPTSTTTPTTTPTPAATVVATATVNVFVVLGTDNSVTLITPGGEMGQGINAGLAQVLSEELPLLWTSVKTLQAPFGNQYGRGATFSQVTGGSNSMRGWFNLMLQAGATARQMLLAAASAQFPSAPTPLKAVAGVVQDANGVVLATYGALAQAASTITLSAPAPILSSPGNYKVVGQKLQRPDVRLKVDGSAIFGIDVHPANMPAVAGMVFAAVRHCPTFGGVVKTVGTAPAGSQVVNLGNAIAATGPTSWTARQNVNAVSVSWTLPSSTVLATADTTKLAAAAQTLMTTATPLASGGTLAVAESVGDVAAGMAGATQKLDVTYSLPFLAHACMEVLNCTVAITKDASGTVTGCQVWAPTQAPDWVAATVATLIPSLQNAAGKPDATRISVNAMFMGGGLGRKIEQDYITQAITVALAVNKPVKLIWFREEDFGHDRYRTGALARVQAGLDAGGNITAWSNRFVAPSLTRSHGGVPKNGLEGNVLGHATGLAYAMGSRLVEYVEQANTIPLGWWRSVGESISCFVVESAIDECAIKAGVDPYQYRRTLLAGRTAELGVLDAAAALAGWGTALPAGHARGIAFSPGFGSLCATVAELALVTTTTTGVTTTTTSYKVVSISVAVDCGFAVNPDQVVGQIEGAVLHGMNAALWHNVQVNNGVAQVRNFGNYTMGRMSTTPQIKVTIVNQGSPLGGMGEVGVPGVAPAIANAYAALSGIRKRSLPLGIETAPANGDG